MRTVHLAIGFCLLVTILSPNTAVAGELETRFADCVALRAVTLDSISAMVELMDSEGLHFDTAQERRSDEQWVEHMTNAVERAHAAAEEFESEPTVYAAVRCEETWRRLTWMIQKALEYSVALTGYSVVDPREVPPEKARRRYELSAQNREVGSAATKQYLWILNSTMDLDLTHGTAFNSYVRAASEELEEAGWSP